MIDWEEASVAEALMGSDLPTLCNYCEKPALYFCCPCHSLVCGGDACEGYHKVVHLEEIHEDQAN